MTMQRIKILLALGLAGALVAGAIGYQQFNKRTASLVGADADAVVTADALFAAYDRDEATADSLYRDRIVEVTGTIERVESDSTGTTVTLSAEDAMIGGVNCRFEPGAAPELPSTGQPVTLVCNCQGMLLDVVLNRCVLKTD